METLLGPLSWLAAVEEVHLPDSSTCYNKGHQVDLDLTASFWPLLTDKLFSSAY